MDTIFINMIIKQMFDIERGRSAMTDNEKELIQIIRNSSDPAKAMAAAIDIIVDFMLDLKNQAVSLAKCEQMY